LADDGDKLLPMGILSREPCGTPSIYGVFALFLKLTVKAMRELQTAPQR
jgi:hypothetical protein